MTKTHPANVFEEEFALGYCPNPEDYDSDFVGPTWDDLLNLLAKEKIKEMYILFCGKARSDGKIGGTGFGLVTQRDVQHVAIALWDEREKEAKAAWEEAVAEWESSEDETLEEPAPLEKITIKSITTDPDNTPYLAKELLGLNVIPEHVTGIVVRKVR